MTIGFWVMLSLAIAWCAYSENFVEIPLKHKVQELKVFYKDKKLQGYNLAELNRIARESEEGYRQGNLLRSDQLLDRAIAQLSAVKEGTRKEELVMPTKHTFSEFPLGVGFGSVYRGEVFMPYIRELGINLTKLYVFWRQIEPQRGKYNWRVIDKFLNQLDQDSEVLIALWSNSKWGTKEHKFWGGSAPLNMDDYYKFVFTLVKHCQGKIRYWQNDCEPNADYWKGSKEEFLSTLKVFYKAVKEADPKAKVIVGGHNGFFTPQGSPGNQPFFDYVFEQGKDYFDIFDLRLYKDIDSIPYRIEWFKKRMRDFGFQKPIVCTEYGGPMPNICPDFHSLKKRALSLEKEIGRRGAKEMMKKEIVRGRDNFSPCLRMFMEDSSKELQDKRHRIHCRDIVSRTILTLSCGIKKLWYWNLINPPHITFGKFRLMDEKFKERYPAFHAYQRMVMKLRGMRSIARLKTKRKDIYLFCIQKDQGKRLYVLWEKRDPFHGEDIPPTRFEHTIDGKTVKITDVFGNANTKETEHTRLKIDVTDTPQYVESIEADTKSR